MFASGVPRSTAADPAFNAKSTSFPLVQPLHRRRVPRIQPRHVREHVVVDDQAVLILTRRRSVLRKGGEAPILRASG